MDPRFILPTSDIIREFRQEDWLFGFYDEGVKGLVRDTVLAHQAHRTEVVCDGSGDSVQARLLEHVIRQYENSLEFRFLENTLGHCHPASMVEMVVLCIDHAVSVMMREFFAGLTYDVCKSHWQWLENDLIVNLLLKDQPCKRAPSICSSAKRTLYPTGTVARSWFGGAPFIGTNSF